MHADPAALRRVYQVVKDRPDLFAERILGMHLWERQRTMLEGIRKFDRSATSSGHKIGKSATIAAGALWIVTTIPGARVICTSASGRQVKAVIWRDLKKWYRAAAERGMPLGGKLHDSPDAGLRFDDGREVIGFSTDAAEKIAGFSGGRLYFLADEASGIDDSIFEAIEGNRAGGAALHLWSNPTQTTGYFFDLFHGKREHLAEGALMTVSSEEVAEAVRLGLAPRGVGLATHGWCKEKRAEWGVGSPIYDVRVAGRFPKESAFSVIGLGMLESAQRRWRDRFELDEEGKPTEKLDPPPPRGRLRVGLDPARFGDDESALCMRRGPRVLRPLDTIRSMDGPTLGAWAAKFIEAEELHDDEVSINVDVNGVGASAFDWLKRYAEDRHSRWTVHPINSGTRVPEGFVDADKYLNLRAWLHFAVRAFLKGDGELPPDSKLEAECLAPRYKFNATNRIQVEGKDELKKRLKRSPDRFDALALTVYEPPEDNTAAILEADQPRNRDEDDDTSIGRYGRTT
jgi:phage terminase large subunit